MKDLPSDRLRIIDANINRLGEGLRVMEEYARLTLNDVSLTQKLKDLRHKLVNVDEGLQIKLLQARAADSDVGSAMDVKDEEETRDVFQSIIANSRRVQESLRVLEELSKTLGLNMDSDNYRQARFELYTVEKDLLGKVLRSEKLPKLSGLYVVIDVAFLKGRDPVQVAEQAIAGGTKAIQLRCKEDSTKNFLAIAKDLNQLCKERGVLFIVNDSLEVALAAGADGLHVGQDDLPVSIARKLMPIDMVLGCSVATVAESLAALADGADYLGVGAIYNTPTKDDAGVVGVNRIKEIKAEVHLPIVAIGGINKENIKEITQAGADGAAVISAVMSAPDVEKAVKELIKIIGG